MTIQPLELNLYCVVAPVPHRLQKWRHRTPHSRLRRHGRVCGVGQLEDQNDAIYKLPWVKFHLQSALITNTSARSQPLLAP